MIISKQLPLSIQHSLLLQDKQLDLAKLQEVTHKEWQSDQSAANL